MTIDEAIKTLRECEISYIHGNKFPNISKEEREHNTKCAEEYGELANWLKELKWWREQDLIRREDVNYIFYDEPILDTAGTCYGLRPPSRAVLQERILRIPKAEPFKEN